jgi:hypothetical protein
MMDGRPPAAVAEAEAADRALYERDEHEWAARQIAALRGGRLDRVDAATLAEYLEDMTRRDYRELDSRIALLLHHLLKIERQPERLSTSWVRTVLTQQAEIRAMLEGTPSMARSAPARVAAMYRRARRLAAGETGLPEAAFPPESPWTLDAALAYDPPPVKPRAAARRPAPRG